MASVPHAVSMASCRYWMQSGASSGRKTPVDDGINHGGRLELNGVNGASGKNLVSSGLGHSVDADLVSFLFLTCPRSSVMLSD